MDTRALVVIHDSHQNVSACVLMLAYGEPSVGGAAIGRALRAANTEDVKEIFRILTTQFSEIKIAPSAYDVQSGYSWEYHVSPTQCSIKNNGEQRTVYSGDVRGFLGYCESTM
jgi:hypothetical protein